MPNILEKPVLGSVGSDGFVITNQIPNNPTGTSIFMKVAFALIASVIVVSVLNKKLPE